MKKLFTRMFAIIFIASIILSGCSGKDKTDNKDADASNSQASGTATTAETSKTPVTWDSEELTWKKDKSPVKFSVFINDALFPLKNWDSAVAKEITKRTGVTLDLIIAANDQQQDVLLASGSLPELVYTPKTTRLETTDISYAWDEIIPEYAPEFMDLLGKDEIFFNTKEDGHFYTILSHSISDEDWKDERALPSMGSPTMGIREDILQAIGNPKLESLDDLVTIFKTVKEKYTDMMVYVPYWPMTSPISEWMGLTKNPYVVGDKVYNGISNPGWLQYYKFMNMLIREGYLSEEVLTYSPDQLYQMHFAGKVFASAANAGYDRVNQVLKATNVPGKFKYIKEPLKVDGEIKFKPVEYVTGYAGLHITKNCKNVQRAIAFAQFLKSPEGMELTRWGIEGVHYTKTAEGLIKIQPEEYNKQIAETGITKLAFMVKGLIESIEIYSQKINEPEFAPEKVEFLQARKSYSVRDPLLGFASPEPESDEYFIGVKVFEIIKNSEPQIITAKSEAEVEQKYQAMMKEIENANIKKLEAKITENYNNAKVKYEEFMKSSK